MPESFHAMLSRIDRDGRMLRLSKEVDARHLSALVVKADRPVLFERVRGFDIPVVGGLFWSRARLAASLSWPEVELALARQQPLPISVSVGVHPIEILSAAFKAPVGVSEIAIAGGLHGGPVRLSSGVTVDVPALADAEIVLEGELLPIGWTEDEG